MRGKKIRNESNFSSVFIVLYKERGNKVIINTGMRTDIPAFYSTWFLNRIKEGYVYVRNPYYRHQVTKYLLNPEVVDCLAFCTKNPHPLIAHLKELDSFRQFWFITITPYGKDMEPFVPDKNQVIQDFIVLSEHLGKKSVALRYDPICITDTFDVQKHIQCFSELLPKFKGYTENCTISFLDRYEKVKRNAPDLKEPTKEEQIKIAKAFSKIGAENGIRIYACCEKEILKEYGLDISGCMSKIVIENAIKNTLDVPNMKKKRSLCHCLLGMDIGEYNTCGHFCRYCYANTNEAVVEENMKRHHPDSPFLIGELEPEDKINEAKQQSWISDSFRLFD